MSGLRTTDEAIDFIYDKINSFLCHGHFNECDHLLSQLDPQKMTVCLMLSYLTISFAAKSKLPSRGEFFERRYSEITKTDGHKRASRLLAGLA